MYIGQIKDFWEISYTHKGTAVPFPPVSTEDCIGLWTWNNAFDNALDVNYTLAKESFVGAVCFNISNASISKAEILIDGEVCGAHTAETGKLTGGEINIPVGKVGKNVTVRFYTKLCLEACLCLGRTQEFEGVAVTEKKVVLYGNESNVKTFKSSHVSILF